MSQPVPIATLHDWLGKSAVLVGSTDGSISGVAGLSSQDAAGKLSFCSTDDETSVRDSKAQLILVRLDLAPRLEEHCADKTIVGVPNPRLSFIKLANQFFPTAETRTVGVDETAAISSGVTLPGSTMVGAHTFIGENCEIGESCKILSNCTVHAGTRLGNRSILQSGVVLGSEGFGFERDGDGTLHRFPHLGSVKVGENVEIGARTCIDRGGLGDTIIGDGTKIDDGVYIAHNVSVGQNCLIMAHAVICGSCAIGDEVEISPGAVIRDKVTVGRGARVGLGAVVVEDVQAGTTVAGVPARAFPVRR